MVLVHTSSCNMCDSEDKVYYHLENGVMKIRYEGCGGYAGRRAEVDNQEVELDIAWEHLNKRVEEIREEVEELLCNMGNALEMMKEMEGASREEVWKTRRKMVREFTKYLGVACS